MLSPIVSSSVCLRVCSLVVFSVGSFSRKLLSRFFLFSHGGRGQQLLKVTKLGSRGQKCPKMRVFLCFDESCHSVFLKIVENERSQTFASSQTSIGLTSPSYGFSWVWSVMFRHVQSGLK